MLHEKIKFEYLGYHFTPVRRLTNKQLNLKSISKHLKSDIELGFSTYSWKKNKRDYTHEGFYKAAGNEDYDLFECEENGKMYIPCDSELFEYIK